MKSLMKYEVFIPYFAAILFQLTIKLHLPSYCYIIPSVILGLYFFPVRILFFDNTQNRTFFFLTSWLFASIFGLTSVYILNPDLRVIYVSLLFAGLICFPIMYFAYAFKTDIKIFFLLFGFSLLASSCFSVKLL